jgi:uncharacterized protein DUF5335
VARPLEQEAGAIDGGDAELVFMQGGTMSRIPQGDWRTALQEFTNRYASRRTVLQVDDALVGLRKEEAEYQLRGVAYDPRSDSIQIMLGQLEGTYGHLTHTIAAPTGVELLPREGGLEEALWIRGREEGALLALL